MQKRIKVLLKDNIYIFAIAVTLIIICLSLIKMPKTNIKISNIDKLYHSIAYFTLTISWLLSFYKKPKKKYIIVISCIILGIIIEVLQNTITIYRTGDLLDVIANSIGVLLALLIFNIIFKKITLINV
ncbi:VanZ family protein [Polaribacter ponticola]|uniref:VanZ family protein n=1 Tax=Polaribacter ponticola TaxID=2978475 RepID=A0ABT5S7X5_9FLAO|nr:VanZ family protein [Polaribacter sp. MSW5]MDD7913606.1 VanZ family protein [Polaribacter sp. MSW5]